jgi:hypothetical protein
MGTLGAQLAAFRFTETSNVEDVRITDVYTFQSVAATSTTKSAFTTLQLFQGSTLVGTANAPTPASSSNPGPGYYYRFTFANPVIVPRANSISLLLRGDVASYSSSGATDNTTHIFRIATSTGDTAIDTTGEVVVAYGATSNATSAITLSSANGNTETVLRSKLVFSAAGLGLGSGRARTTADDFSRLTFTADAAGSIAVNSVIVTFSGTLPSAANFLDGVTLLNEFGTVLGATVGSDSGNTTSSACTGGTSTCTKTFNLGSTSNGQSISAGQSRAWTLRVESSRGQSAVSNQAHTLNATIAALTDIRYTDALDSAAATAVGLPTKTTTPVNLNSVSYAVGT